MAINQFPINTTPITAVPISGAATYYLGVDDNGVCRILKEQSIDTVQNLVVSGKVLGNLQVEGYVKSGIEASVVASLANTTYLTFGGSNNKLNVKKKSGVVMVNGVLQITTTNTSAQTVGTLATEYRPTAAIYINVADNDGEQLQFRINADGSVLLTTPKVVTNKFFPFFLTYVSRE